MAWIVRRTWVDTPWLKRRTLTGKHIAWLALVSIPTCRQDSARVQAAPVVQASAQTQEVSNASSMENPSADVSESSPPNSASEIFRSSNAQPPLEGLDAADSAVLRQAQAAWNERSDRTQLEHAITLWGKHLGSNPHDAACATWLAHGLYLLADGPMTLSHEEEGLIDVFERGVEAAEQALMGYSSAFADHLKAGDKVEDSLHLLPTEAQGALYWYADNLGRYALAKGFTTTLFYKDRIFAVMQQVLAMDETFYYAAPHRFLGSYYAKLPSFAGGDLAKAHSHFERALQLSPGYLANKVLYAEAYATHAEDRNLFLQILQDVKNAPIQTPPETIPEQLLEQQKAQRLLARIDELF